MTLQARYVHTNLIARDWQKLSEFYRSAFGCTVAGPERDLSGPWLQEATGVPGARIRGVHVRLPGWGPQGPTLEIFAYDTGHEGTTASVDRPGFGHIAFAVDDVEEAVGVVIEHGGRRIGKTATGEVPGAGRVTFVYLADPEGNIIELQKWG